MAKNTRKPRKVLTKLFGGPFHGSSMYLTPVLNTLPFVKGDFAGYYTCSGSWISTVKPTIVEIANPQIILGYN